MSDLIRLSLWLPTQTTAQILPHLAKAVEVLPTEALERGVQQLSVTAVAWTEPPLIEERFQSGIPVADALEQMREFIQDDCVAEAEMAWLLWMFEEGSWRQQPQTVRFSSFGPLFEAGVETEMGHVCVTFGLDEAFLAELAPWDRETRNHLQANILQLLAFAHKLQAAMRPQRRQLWSEGEPDWTQRFIRRLEQAQ